MVLSYLSYDDPKINLITRIVRYFVNLAHGLFQIQQSVITNTNELQIRN